MMDVPQRNAELRRLGYNLQRNESECYQLPGRPPANTRSHLSSQVPSRMHSQLQRSASNQIATRTPGSMRNNVPVPFPNNSTTGHTNVENLPCSAASIPQRYAFKNDVPFETLRSGQVTTTLQNKDHCATTFRSVYGDSLPDGGKYGQQADGEVFANQSNQVEGARGFRTVGDHDRVSDARNTTGFQQRSSNNLNYINPKLVQKVLDSQKKRAQTPVGHLYSGNKEVPLVSAGQRRTRLEKPEHHSSDTSLSNRMADCRVTDPETVSTGSQKESGYHSGDSVGDRLSENSEPGRNMPWGPTATQPFPAIPGTPDDVCEHYFLKGDSLMDMCNEQERFGNWQQALNFLNQAIDFFQQATNVPGVSHDNVLRMRLKHNRAVLHRRKLLKQSGCSTEAPTRRLPCTPQEVKERSTTADVLPRHHQPICDHFNKVPTGLDYNDDTRNRGMGFGRGPPLYPDDGTGNINLAECGNCENVSLGVGNPDLPEAGLQWTSDDVKDIKIYATLPKNRRRNGGPLVSNTPTINPVQTVLQSEILISCRNEESQHPSTTRNTGGHRVTDGYDYQQVPNHSRHGGMMHSRDPVPERLRQMPCTDVPRFQESQSHYFRSDDVNARRMDGSTSDQTKFVRF